MSKVKFKKGDDQMFLRCASLKTIKTPKKTKKSITMVCMQSKSPSTTITGIQSSGKKIMLSWSPVSSDVYYAPAQYEVQCSTNKKFSDAVGKMTNTTDITYSVQDNVTNATSTTIKGLTKGKPETGSGFRLFCESG